jgi:hypothetical protein
MDSCKRREREKIEKRESSLFKKCLKQGKKQLERHKMLPNELCLGVHVTACVLGLTNVYQK